MSTLYECRYCGHMSPNPWITCLRCGGRWVEWGLSWLPGHLERLRRVEQERDQARDTACRMMEEAEQLKSELASANEVLRRLRRQEER